MLYVVNCPNENHFFFNSKEARADFREGKQAMKQNGENGEISIFKMPPLLDSDGQINDYDRDNDRYFKDAKNPNKILSEYIN